MIELTIILLVPIALAVVVVTMSRPATVAVTSDGGSDVRDVLVHRFIERSQRFRRGGAIVALLAAMAYLVALESVDRSGVNLNLLVFASIGLAGSIGGSILAEAFRVRHRRRGPRIASLDVRDPEAYRDRAADLRERVLVALALAGLVGAVITGENRLRVAALGAVVIVLAGLRRWVMHRIALRPRPVVSADVAAADDEVRRLASSAGISRPMVTLGALAVSAQWLAVVSPRTDPTRTVQVVSIVAWIGSIGLFIAACGWWWTNRSFGLVPAHLEAVGGSRSHLLRWTLGVLAVCITMMVLLIVARSQA